VGRRREVEAVPVQAGDVERRRPPREGERRCLISPQDWRQGGKPRKNRVVKTLTVLFRFIFTDPNPLVIAVWKSMGSMLMALIERLLHFWR
jgi:hypothetical protein